MKVQELIEELKQFEKTLPVQFEYEDYNYDINVDNLSTSVVQEDNDLIFVTTDVDNNKSKHIKNVKELVKTLKNYDNELNVMVKYHDFELGNMFINIEKVAKKTEFDEFNNKFEYCTLNKII